MNKSKSVAFLPIGQVVGATVLARWRGQLRLTVITKATFAFVQNGELSLMKPAPLAVADEHYGNTPLRSARVASDMAPHLAHVDVLFAGHAYAPAGTEVQRMVVRLGLANDAGPLIDKRLDVIGDRKRDANGAVSEPAPFKKLPLVYERALGGRGSAGNPVGIGHDSIGLLPNLLHSETGRSAEAAGFGPIPAIWAARKDLLRGLSRESIDASIAELPDDFAWPYFQAAPADQRTKALRGREWIVLEGVNEKHGNLYMRLPAVRAGACVYTLDAEPRTFALEPDTLFLDGDAERATITFRGSFALENEGALEGLSVASGIDLPGHPLVWPAPPRPKAQPVAQTKASAHVVASETFVFPDFDVIQSKGLPFVAPAAPNEKASVADKPIPAIAKQTFVLPDDVVLPIAATPFEAASPATPARSTRESAAPIPGAPWGSISRAPLPASYSSTLYLDDILSSPPAPPPMAPPPIAMPVAATPLPAAFKSTPSRPPPHAAPLPERLSELVPARIPITIPFISQTTLVAFTMPWQVRARRDSITVIIKGTFDIVPGARASLRAESDAPSGDVHANASLDSSLLYATDFAILKPRADVTLTGHAYAPSGSAATAHVRFRVGRGDRAFDRKLAVIGDRYWQNGSRGPSTSPIRFERMPLVHERAYGGPGFARNPVGAGRTPSADGRIALPNLEDPTELVKSASETPAPTCFGPIPMSWTARTSKLGTYDASWLKERWPYFPDDIDWSYFQSAPPEQQVDYLDGDEPFLLAGVHPNHAVIEGELPHLRVRCFAQRTSEAGGDLFEVKLRLDTAAFEPDRMTVNLVWRGLLEVRDDEASELAEMFVMTEEMGKPAASVEDARAKLLAIKASSEPVPEVIQPTAAPANDQAPEAEESDDLDTEIDALEPRIRERFAAAGVAFPSNDAPAPPRRSAKETLDAIRASGMPASAVAEMEAAMAPDPDPEEPHAANASDRSLLRAKAIAMLEAGASFDGEDFAAADLSGLDFTGRSLIGANLKEANLAGARFESADLTGAQLGAANLSDAVLDGANLESADLVLAILRRASLKAARVERADFSKAIGEDAILEGARGKSASFSGGDWTRASFACADLAEVDFTRAVLDETVFEAAVLLEIRLYDARGRKTSFAKAQMAGARADGCALFGCSFARAEAPNSIWEKATLDDSTFFGAALAGAAFARSSCRNVVFSGSDAVGSRFDRAKLMGASLLKANFMKASLEAADLSNADFRGANLHGAELWKAKLGGARFDEAILTKTKLGGAK